MLKSFSDSIEFINYTCMIYENYANWFCISNLNSELFFLNNLQNKFNYKYKYKYKNKNITKL
jgi:hypothetical protein